MKEFILNQILEFYEQTGKSLSKDEILERIEIYFMALELSSYCEEESLRSVLTDTKILIEDIQKMKPDIVSIRLIEPSLRLISYIVDKNYFEKRKFNTATLGVLYSFFEILGDKEKNKKYYDILYSKDEKNSPYLYQDEKHPENILRKNKEILPFVMTYCARNAAMHSQEVPNKIQHLLSMFYTLIEVCYKYKNIIMDKYLKNEKIYKSYVDKIVSDYEEKLKNNFKYIPLNMIAYKNYLYDNIILECGDEDSIDFEKVNKKFPHVKIIGYAGMGKTTLLENITYNEILEFKKKKFNVKIPVILDMIKVTSSNYKEMTIENLINLKFGVGSIALVKRMIEKNILNIYIDGINEIQIKDKAIKKEYLNTLEEFISRHRGVKIIVTDRDDNSYSVANDEATLILIGVTEKIVKEFVLGNSSKPEIVWDRINSAILKNPNLLNICKNPFMLKNLISIVECNRDIPEDEGEIVGVFLKSIVERERVIKKDEMAEDVLRVLIYLVAKETESEEFVEEDTIVLTSFKIFEIFNEYCDKYKRKDRFDNSKMIDLIVKLGILKEIDLEKYTFVENDYFEFFYTCAIDLGLI